MSNTFDKCKWLDPKCSICSDLRDLGSSLAGVKVRQTAPRVTEVLELCLWQSRFIFHSDSIYSIKFCHTVVSMMLWIKIESTIFRKFLRPSSSCLLRLLSHPRHVTFVLSRRKTAGRIGQTGRQMKGSQTNMHAFVLPERVVYWWWPAGAAGRYLFL